MKKKLLVISIFLLFAGTVIAGSLKPYAFPFIGRWQPSEDPALIDDYGFQDIQNLRKDGKRLKGVSGHTKVNTIDWSPTYAYPKNGFHFIKAQPAESHVIISATDSAGANARLYQNTTAIPDQGEFTIDFDNESNKIVDDYSLDGKELSDWTNYYSTDTQDSTTAPDGTTTGVKLTEDSTASQPHFIYYTNGTLSDDTSYTWSVFFKAGTKNRCVLKITEETPWTDNFYARIDLSTGTINSTVSEGDVTLESSSITSYPNSWYLVTLTGQFGSAISNEHNMQMIMIESNSTWNTTYDGDGSSYIYVWGAKMTESSSYQSEPEKYVDDTSAGLGRFSLAPKGNMIYCNGEETLIWGGDELPATSFIVSTNSITNTITDPKDFSEEVVNTLQTADEVAQILNGLDTNTVLALHCDGADASTTFTDHSDSAHIVTSNGSAQIDTDYKKFGTGSGLFDDDGSSYLSIPDHADWNFGSGNFTIDFWVRFNAVSGTVALFYTENAGSNVYLTHTAPNAIQVNIDDGVDQLLWNVTWTPATDTWYHITLVRGWSGNANDWAFIVDGSSVDTTTDTQTCPDVADTFKIGGTGTGNYFDGWIDEFRISKGIARWTSNFSVPVRPYKNIGRYWLVGATRPIQGVKYYVQTPNITTSTMTAQEWNGSSWDTLSITDNTSSGGISLAQTGTVTWSTTEDTSKTAIYSGLSLYWYQFELSAGGAEVYYCTVDAPIQTIKNIWNSVPATCTGFFVYDNSLWEDYSEHVNMKSTKEYASEDFAAELDSLAAAEYVYVCFPEQTQGVNLTLPQNVNENAAVLSVYYWAGHGWESVGTVNDGTSVSGASLAQSGYISWNPPERSEEFTRQIFGLAGMGGLMKSKRVEAGETYKVEVKIGPKYKPKYRERTVEIIEDKYVFDNTQQHYYKFQWSAALDADVLIDTFSGVTSENPFTGYKFSVLYQNRAFLFCETAGFKNAAIYSAYENPDTFNGGDSGRIIFGDNTEIIAAAPLYNLYRTAGVEQLVVAKKHETYRVTGTDPTNWEKYKMSTNIGCIAPLSMVTCDVAEIEEGIKRQVVIWQTDTGVVKTDGATIESISDDIECYFDPNDSRCIPTARLDDSVGVYDPVLKAYKLLISSGSGQTTHNVELEYSLENNEWTKVYRENSSGANPLQIAFQAHDTSGKSYIFGATDEAYMYRLEDGKTWDGTGITQYVQTKDLMIDSEQPLFKHTNIDYLRLMFTDKATGDGEDIDVIHYCDQTTTTHGTNDQFVPTDIDMANGPHELRECTLGPCLYHSFLFTSTTSTVYDGMELTGMGLYYDSVKTIME